MGFCSIGALRDAMELSTPMKLITERNALLKALGHVASVVERRNTIPILSNMLLRANESGQLLLTATDLDIEVVETIDAEVGQAGATTVPAHVLHDIVRKLPDGAQVELSLEEGGGQMQLRSGRARFNLQVLSPDDFPSLAAEGFVARFEMLARDIKELIEKTRFAMSTEETRYYLNGIYLHAAPAAAGDGGGEEVAQMLRAVATDGHRLAQAEMPLPDGAAGMPGVIVPRKTVYELHRIVDTGEMTVTIELSESKIRFTAGSVVLTSKLIEGTFPDYVRVIPYANDKSMVVPVAEFASAVDRVSTLASEKGRAVKLAVSGGALALSVNNPDSGSAEEEIAVDYSETPMEIGFNARYLLDVAGQLDGGEARFLLSDSSAPVLIRETEEATDGVVPLYVLMPMRV